MGSSKNDNVHLCYLLIHGVGTDSLATDAAGLDVSRSLYKKPRSTADFKLILPPIRARSRSNEVTLDALTYRMKRVALSVAWLLILLLSTSPGASAITYECATFSIPGGTSHASGMNNSGVIVGTFKPSSGLSRGFIRDPQGNIALVDYPGAMQTALQNINDHGKITGSASLISGQQVNFVLDPDGQFHVISLPPPYDQYNVQINGINDTEDIAGFLYYCANGSCFSDSPSSFFILSADGKLTLVPPQGQFLKGLPGSLNNSRQLLEMQVNGQSIVTSLLESDLSLTPIRTGYPGYDGTILTFGLQANGINNAGAVVGFIPTDHTGSYANVPFLRDTSGAFSEIVCPQTRHFYTLPFAVNDAGIIAGDNAFTSGASASFVATPVAGLAQFGVSASSLTFAPLPLGQTSPGQSITITNSGNARMDIGAIDFASKTSPYPVDDFHVVGCVDPATGYSSLSPGASCVITVSATPKSPGNITDQLIIHDSGPGSPHLIRVSITVPRASCTSTFVNGTQRKVNFLIQDVAFGLQSIVVANATNAAVSIPTFTAGFTGPVTAVMTEVDPSHAAYTNLRVTSTANAVTECAATIAGGSNQWSGFTPLITGRAALVNDGIFLNAFARGSDGRILHAHQQGTDLRWFGWDASYSGAFISEPVAVLEGGSVRVVEVGADQHLYTAMNSYAGWASWEPLGGVAVGNPAAIRNADGRTEVFVRGADLALWHNVQTTGNSSWSGWTSLGGYLLTDPVAAVNGAGSLEIFAQGGDHSLWHIAQSTPGSGAWTQWTTTGIGEINGNPALVLNKAGLLELFVRCSDKSLWHNVQSSRDDPSWTGWTSLGGYLTSDPAAAVDQDGRVEVFGRGGDNALWRNAQTSASGSWSGWMSLGGVLSESITAVTDGGGRIGVYARAPDNTLWHIGQVLPGYWY